MSRALCFRCDWDGEVRGASCPRCGAPLHRVEQAPPRRAGERDAPRSPEVPSAEAPFEPGPRTSARKVLLGLGVLAVLALGAMSWLPDRPAGAPLPLQAGPKADVVLPPEGKLVYAAEARNGRQELWKINLAFGEVVAGPTVPAASQIVDASSVKTGSLGLTAPRADGTVGVFALEGTTPHDRPRALGVGNLVAWGSRGRSVAIADVGRAEGGCRSVVIDVLDLETGSTDRVLDEPNLCGDLLTLGRAGPATYFTLSLPSGTSIGYTGVSAVPHPVLGDYVMVSISPSADFLVTKAPGAAAAGTAPDVGVELFWRGLGGPVPLGTAEDALVVREVLAWSSDGARAMVLGRLGAREGLFQIQAGPGPEAPPREPTFVAPAGTGLGATYAADGTAFFVSGGHLFSYRDGEPEEIALPTWAPRPAGPMVWTP